MEEIGLTGPQRRKVRATADDIIADPRSGAMAPDSVTRIREAMTDRCATADALVRWALAGETEDIKLVAALADLCVAAECWRAADALVGIAAGQAERAAQPLSLVHEDQRGVQA
jgi:hypothetical protein